jgi:hypothetical protein
MLKSAQWHKLTKGFGARQDSNEQDFFVFIGPIPIAILPAVGAIILRAIKEFRIDRLAAREAGQRQERRRRLSPDRV